MTNTTYKLAGAIRRAHLALKIDLEPPYPLGDLVVGAGDVQGLIAGKQVDVTFVQQRPGRAPFLGFAGTARRSRGRIMIRVDGATYSASASEVEQTYAGIKPEAAVTKTVTARPPVIDGDLVKAF